MKLGERHGRAASIRPFALIIACAHFAMEAALNDVFSNVPYLVSSITQAMVEWRVLGFRKRGHKLPLKQRRSGSKSSTRHREQNDSGPLGTENHYSKFTFFNSEFFIVLFKQTFKRRLLS